MADSTYNFPLQLTPETESPSSTVATSNHDTFSNTPVSSMPNVSSVPNISGMLSRSNTTHVPSIASIANIGGSIKRSNSADIIRSNSSSGSLSSAHPLPSTSAHSTTNHSHSHAHHHHHHGAGSAQAAAAAQPMPPLPGATIYTPTAPPSAELNPRSCVTCRRRKVRCDKLMPCTNCRRALVPCIFPAPERAPRRPRRKDPSAILTKPHQSSEREIELLKRLRKLEGIVEELSGQVELEAGSSSGKVPLSSSNSPEATGTSVGDTGASNSGQHPRSSVDHTGNTPSASSSWGHSPKPANATLSNPPSASGGSPGRLVSRNGPALKQKTKDTQKQFGRLMINDYGKSRYVSSAFWSKINDELDDLRAETHRISDASESDDSASESSPALIDDERPVADHHAFIFGFQSTAVDLRPLHPLPSQIPYIWQVYQENVDPVIKILHTPSTTKLIRNARTNLDNIAPAAEALMFAIYYAAVNSLEESEVSTMP